jgi:isopentenyl-diphosphate delta-isomerase
MEQLILVNKNDRFLGRYSPKQECHQGAGLHHRAFTLLIYNSKTEILLQDRKHQLWDHSWDLTNSHLLHLEDGTDETYEQSVSRCLKREWGVDFPVEKTFGFNYFAKLGNLCENEYCYFLMGKHNGNVYLNPEVAYGCKWVSFTGVAKDLKIHPKIYTPWLLKGLEEFQRHPSFRSFF